MTLFMARRPIDPPPIIQLLVHDPRGHELLTTNDAAFYVMHVSLYHEKENKKLDYVVNPFRDVKGKSVLAQSIVGSVVSPCYVAVAPNGAKGMYFAFPDLSCRVNGKYRLLFRLFHLSQDILRLGSPGEQIAEMVSQPFTAFQPKEFPGMSASTELSRCFSRQGVQIHIRPDPVRRG